MSDKLKIGKEAILVNMGFIHKGYLGYDKANTLFQIVKIEKISEDTDGELWVNRNLRAKYVFKNVEKAKEFVSKYLKQEILKKKKDVLEIGFLINYYEQILLKND
jgi:hypothetical protein